MSKDNKTLEDPIDLTLEPERPVGAARLLPRSRELVWPSGRAMVEPRVMQVLIALARASGEVVTRDALIAACWEGRVVSEDAINRALSQARRVAHAAGDPFAIETIAKVGYRLVAASSSAPAAQAPAAAPRSEPPRQQNARRRIAILAGATALAGLAGWTLWPRSATPPPEAVALYLRAREANATASGGEYDRGIAFLEEAVTIAPDYADAWGLLASSYAVQIYGVPPAQHAAQRGKARKAAERALALDPRNDDALNALALLAYRFRNWLEAEAAARAALDVNPNSSRGHVLLARILLDVGRTRAAIAALEKAHEHGTGVSRSHGIYGEAIWTTGETSRAKAVLTDAIRKLPRNLSLWFPLFYIHVFAPDPSAVRAMIDDEATRPRAIPLPEFELWHDTSVALASGAANDRARAVANHLAFAPKAAGYMSNAIGPLARFGERDEAFRLLRILYGLAKEKAPDRAFSETQPGYLTLDQRQTRHLFLPQCKALRTDPRFDQFCIDVGLDAYWAATKTRPDYRLIPRDPS